MDVDEILFKHFGRENIFWMKHQSIFLHVQNQQTNWINLMMAEYYK